MKKTLTISLLLTLTYQLIGQGVINSRPGEKPSIQAIAKSWGDSISLRWAPTNATAWKRLNQSGYDIRRITIKRNGRVLFHHEQDQKKLAEVKPTPGEQWNPHIESNDYVGIAAQAIYGESFNMEQYGTGPIAIYNQAQELENRYSFTLFSADQDVLTAKLSGLSYTDRYVKKGEQYLYIISSKVPQASYAIDSGVVLIATDDLITTGAPDGLEAQFGDQSVQLRWVKPIVRSPFTGYVIERSTNGKEYTTLNQKPYIGTEDEEGRQKSKYLYFIDSLPQNNTTYYYRIRGRTPFGELSGPSNVQKGKGALETNGEVPLLNNPKVIDNKTVYLHWTYPEAFEKAIQGFAIYRTRAISDQGYQEITKGKLLSPKTRRWEDKRPNKTNFYQVAAIDNNGKVFKSVAVLAQLQDSIPPAAPKKVTGTVNDSGKVQLHWLQNTEEDLRGYQVFRSYHPEDHFFLMSRKIKADTNFTDSLPTNTLNDKIYYKIIALDWNVNKSDFSDLLTLELPDQFPPTSPIFKAISSVDSGVFVQWNHSSSKDLAFETLYKRTDTDTTWKAITQFKPDSNWTNHYLDQGNGTKSKAYYQLRATDVHGLESKTEKYVTGVFANALVTDKLVITEVRPELGEGFMYVSWREPKQALSGYELYRSTNEGPLRLLKRLDKETIAIEDRVVEPQNTYSYCIRAVYADGRKSGLSKRISKEY